MQLRDLITPTSWIGVIGFCLITAKLIGILDLSWWLVLLPFYAGIASVVVVMLTAVTFAGLVIVVGGGTLIIIAAIAYWLSSSGVKK